MTTTRYKRSGKTVAQMSAPEIVELFTWYDFRDRNGNPLTRCTDFLELIQRAFGEPSDDVVRPLPVV